jgi:hypothetical protein
MAHGEESLRLNRPPPQEPGPAHTAASLPCGQPEFEGIGSFLGGEVKVKAIRVVRYDPKLTPSLIRDEVLRVWLAIFSGAYSQVMWSKGNPWNIEASVEYEDGKRTSILMDGLHVQFQDRAGKYWYTRLWPAVE